MALTEKQAPFTEPYALVGNPRGLKSKGPTAIAVKRALWHLGFFPNDPPYDAFWNAKLNNASAEWKRKRGLIPADSNDGSWGRKAHTVMQSAWYMKNGKPQPAFDPTAQKLLQQEKAGSQLPETPVPDLGPLWNGGLSLLDHDLTHPTSSIDYYPALDDAFEQGRVIIAPEKIVVHKWDTSARPGEAFYAIGESKIQYWFGHLDRDHPIGTAFGRGAMIGRVAPNNVGGGPHVHAGINVENLFGTKFQLEHHTDYTHGAPTIGEQLVKLLA